MTRSQPSLRLEWWALACFVCAGLPVPSVLWTLVWFVTHQLHPDSRAEPFPVSWMLAIVAVFLVPVCAFVTLGLALRFHFGRPRSAEGTSRSGPAVARPGATGGATPP